MIAEKWVSGKEPFQVMWEYMDSGWLVVDNMIPQGLLTFIEDQRGMMVLNLE